MSGQTFASRMVSFQPQLRVSFRNHGPRRMESEVPFSRILSAPAKRADLSEAPEVLALSVLPLRSCAHRGAEVGLGRPPRVDPFALEYGVRVSSNLGRMGGVTMPHIFCILMF